MRRFYLYAFLNGMQFTYTTWLAYVLAHGGNPGWAEAAFHLAILLGEVPTGILADLMGRRISMLVGLALSAVGALGYFWVNDTLSACLVLGFSGLAGTFLSGADTALLYETASAKGGQELARKAMARATALTIGAAALAPAIAGVLYQWQDWAPFVGKSVMSLITLAVVWGMKEPPPEPRAERISPWRQALQAVQAVRAVPAAMGLMAFGWLYNTVLAMTGQFAQAYFPFVGLSMGAAGVVFGSSQLLSSGGSALAERLTERGARRWLRFAPAGVGLAVASMGLAAALGSAGSALPGLLVAGGVGAYLLAGGADGVIYPVWQARLNEAIPSAQRATILSLSSMGFSLLMTISFPAASYLPLPSIYLITGGAGLLLAMIWMARRWSY